MSPLVLSHQEINQPIWLAFNWSWDPRWMSLMEMFNTQWVVEYDFRYLMVFLSLFPFLYFFYLPIAPVMTIVFFLWGSMFLVDPSISVDVFP